MHRAVILSSNAYVTILTVLVVLMLIGPIGIELFMSNSAVQFTLIRLINFQTIATIEKEKGLQTNIYNVFLLVGYILDLLNRFLYNNQ